MKRNNRPPFFLKDKEFIEPDLPFYYLLASDGLFMVKNFQLYSAAVKIENGLPWLERNSEKLYLKFPKIPKSIIEKAIGFFYTIYQLYKSEAIFILFYNQKEKKFKFAIPRQVVEITRFRGTEIGSYFLNYSRIPSPPDYVRVASIHSHGDMIAFYSWTDEKDSRYDDGLNIVVGNLNLRYPSFYACFMIQGTKFDLPIEDVIEGYDKPYLPVPERWLKKVKQETLP